jgi:hypothetical protein
MAPMPRRQHHQAATCTDATAHPRRGRHRTTSHTSCSVWSLDTCRAHRQVRRPDATAPGPRSRLPFLLSAQHTLVPWGVTQKNLSTPTDQTEMALLLGWHVAQIRTRLDEIAVRALDGGVETFDHGHGFLLAERFAQSVAQRLHVWIILERGPVRVIEGEHVCAAGPAVHKVIPRVMGRRLQLLICFMNFLDSAPDDHRKPKSRG